MRKPAFCKCEYKAADQLPCYRAADQHLCFCYMDSTIAHLAKSEISSFWQSSVAVQPSLCQTWSETGKTDKSQSVSIFMSAVQFDDFLAVRRPEQASCLINSLFLESRRAVIQITGYLERARLQISCVVTKPTFVMLESTLTVEKMP